MYGQLLPTRMVAPGGGSIASRAIKSIVRISLVRGAAEDHPGKRHCRQRARSAPTSGTVSIHRGGPGPRSGARPVGCSPTPNVYAEWLGRRSPLYEVVEEAPIDALTGDGASRHLGCWRCRACGRTASGIALGPNPARLTPTDWGPRLWYCYSTLMMTPPCS